MHFGGDVAVIRKGAFVEEEGNKSVGPVVDNESTQCSLSMYLQPLEMGVITLDEFQAMGTKRLSVLRKVEELKEKFGSGNLQDEYKKAFREEIGILMPLATNSCINAELGDARREDHISHFILRLAFCHVPDQSDWFVRLETELFRMRFQNETNKNLAYFLTSNDIKLNSIGVSERSQFIDDISQALSLTVEEIAKTDLYKVDFIDVLELLPSHRIFLNNGTAYISSNELFALAAPRFRDNISASISRARKEIDFLQENDRLIPLMRNMVQGGVTYRQDLQDPNAEHINSHMIESLAHSSFPLCMRQIYSVLRKEHHLRHFARRQFGLFLKGVGLSLEGSIELFRSEFTKKIEGEKFSKEYAYNIRHMYGKEGSRIDQKPLSCTSIILGSSPTAHDCHGCPFKHSDVSRLSSQLEAVGIDNDQIGHILDLSKMQRFDKACTKYFEYSHNVPDLEELITHPNQFYSLSRKVRRGEFVPRKGNFEGEENME